MNIIKTDVGYALQINDVTIYFDEYEKEGICLYLKKSGWMVATLYFDDATEFYKAWRAM